MHKTPGTCSLHVWDLWDHLEQMVVLQPFLGQETSDEVRVSHWCPQHFEALLGCGQSLVASPHHRLWIMHPRNCRKTCHPCGPLAFHNLVLPKWMLMLARLWSSVSNNWNTSCTLDGLQMIIVPHRPTWGTVELTDEWDHLDPVHHVAHALKDGVARDEVVRTNAIHGQNGSFRVFTGQCLADMSPHPQGHK